MPAGSPAQEVVLSSGPLRRHRRRRFVGVGDIRRLPLVRVATLLRPLPA
ncbi:hypothetical protein [Streptomyces humidus]